MRETLSDREALVYRLALMFERGISGQSVDLAERILAVIEESHVIEAKATAAEREAAFALIGRSLARAGR